jgi:hypothetical protein
MTLWIFSVQPKGVAVVGEVDITISVPKINDSYGYMPEDAVPYVVLLGYNPAFEVIEPIGVGRRVGAVIESTAPVAVSSLDFFGYAMVPEEQSELLGRVAGGEASLAQLKAALSRYR